MRGAVDRLVAAALLVATLIAAGCGGDKLRDDPILRLSAEEALAEGKELMAAEKYVQAEEYLSHAFEVEPNSPSGREALLLAGDALYKAGGVDNLVRAESRYRDFQNRFPTSDKGAYVLFQIANSLAERVRKPDRDQSATEKALQAYGDVLALYPTSEYAEEARKQIVVLRQLLGESEFLVGRFYYRLGLSRAAIARFEGLEEAYPDYVEMDKVLFHLGMSYRKGRRYQEAIETFDRLQAVYPESVWLKDVPSREDLERKAAELAAAEAKEKAKAEAKTAGDVERDVEADDAADASPEGDG